MKGLIYFMKWYVLTLSISYGKKLNCIYLFLKYKRIHQLIRMLWYALSNSFDIVNHILAGNHVVLPFSLILLFVFCFVLFFCFAILSLILHNSWSFFVSVLVCPNLILYKKYTLYTYSNILSCWTDITWVNFFQVPTSCKRKYFVSRVWNSVLLYQSYPQDSHLLALPDNSFDSSQLFLNQFFLVIMLVFVAIDLDL